MADQPADNRSWLRLGTGISLAVLVIAGIAYGLFRYFTPPEPAPKARGNAEQGVDPEELDRLRSLGYLDFVPANKDDTRSGILRKTAASYPGYNFFTNAFLCVAVLTDPEGQVVNYWQQKEFCDRWANAEFLENGDVLVVGRTERKSDSEELDDLRFLMKLSWEGEIQWKRPVAAHHDIEVAPDGKLLTLTTDLRTLPEVHPTLPIRDNRITLLSPDGTELDHASLYDLFHASPEIVTLQQVRPKNTNEIDLIHANSVEWIRPEKQIRKRTNALYSADNILFSTRHQDVVGIMNWKTRKLLWAWGQEILSGPHDATMLPSGNILLFDNGLKRGWSRIIELNPVTNKIVWSYAARKQKDFFTAARGSNQRLPNGNTLISESDKGHAFEIQPDGQVAWEYLNPFRNAQNERATIVRFYRIEPDVIQRILAARGEGRRNPPLQISTGRTSRETY